MHHHHLLLGLLTIAITIPSTARPHGVEEVQEVQQVQQVQRSRLSLVHRWTQPSHLLHPLHLVHLAPSAAGSQGKVLFRARLAVVPIDVVQQSTVAGNGTVTATLIGSKLTIAGTFANLKTPATFAKIHVGPKGIRGPAIFDLTVSKATSGTLEGVFDLTPQQVDDLSKSRLYVQLHSEKAPEGNLWGWLLPQEGRK